MGFEHSGTDAPAASRLSVESRRYIVVRREDRRNTQAPGAASSFLHPCRRAPQFFALIFVALTVKRHTRRAYAIVVSLPRRTPGAGARQERTAALTAS